MSARNKVRSREQENEIVDFWTERQYDAERAYASVGESLTDSRGNQLTEDVDCIVYKAMPNNKDLLIQAKRRKSLGSYLIPDEFRDAVFLQTEEEKPNLYVFPDHLFVGLLESQPRFALHLDVQDRTSASVANYVYPPEGADVTAMRPDHQTDNLYVVPEKLFEELHSYIQLPSSADGGSNELNDPAVAEAFRNLASQINTLADQISTDGSSDHDTTD